MNTTPAARPPIREVVYISAEGNPCTFRASATIQIRETEENGEYCMIPWVEVWDGIELLARIPQNKLEHILYQRAQ